jgi:hypothetical protein
MKQVVVVIVASLAGAAWTTPIRAPTADSRISPRRQRIHAHLGHSGPTAEGGTALAVRGAVTLEQPVADGHDSGDPVEDLKSDLRGTIDKMKDTDPKRIVKKEEENAKETFIPGWRDDWESRAIALICIPLGVAWLVFYRYYLYKHDHEDIHYLGPQDVGKRSKLRPDIVIVFHHPNYDYPDKLEDISRAKLEQLNFDDSMPRMIEATKGAKQQSVGSLVQGIFGSTAGGAGDGDDHVGCTSGAVQGPQRRTGRPRFRAAAFPVQGQ